MVADYLSEHLAGFKVSTKGVALCLGQVLSSRGRSTQAGGVWAREPLAHQLGSERVELGQSIASGLEGDVFHSDRGSVDTSNAFQDTCTQVVIGRSIGSIRTSVGNALAKSFNAALKQEALQDSISLANH